jgi:hypothetical protein
VSSGFQGFREINTVIYDPELISSTDMINALKKADTYIGIARE